MPSPTPIDWYNLYKDYLDMGLAVDRVAEAHRPDGEVIHYRWGLALTGRPPTLVGLPEYTAAVTDYAQHAHEVKDNYFLCDHPGRHPHEQEYIRLLAWYQEENTRVQAYLNHLDIWGTED